MKKLVTLAILMLSVMAADARTVKLTVSDYFAADAKSKTLSFNAEGFTLTATQGTSGSTSNPAYFSSYGDFCVYAGGTLTVTSTDENILSVVFELSSEGKKKLGAFTPNVGKISYTSFVPTWTGNAQSITFTAGKTIDYGDGSGSAQFRFLSVKFITDGTGPDVDDTPDLTKYYPFTQGKATFYGTTYSANNNFTVEVYSEGISLVYDSELDANVVEGTGTYAMFDLYTADAKTFTGTYTSAQASNVGGLDCGDATSSVWYACGRSNCLSPQILNGSVTITCGTSGMYYIEFDVKDTEGNTHTGKTGAIRIDVKRENGTAYAVTNSCTTDDTAVSSTEINDIFAQNGEILGLAQGAIIYNITGQNVTAENGQLRAGIYVVRQGNTVHKIVLK